MRTQLLGALALLCGAGIVHAQQWPANAYYGYNQGYYQPRYGAGYPTMPAGNGYSGYPQNGYPQNGSAQGYQQAARGYAYNPYYTYNPYYAAYYRSYYASQYPQDGGTPS